VIYTHSFIYYSRYVILGTNSIVEIKKATVKLIDNQSSLTGDTQLTLLPVIHSGNGTNTLKATLMYLLCYEPRTQNIVLLRSESSRVPRNQLQ
jgi:hypothetical protein